MGGLFSKFRRGGRGETDSVPPTPEGTLSRQHQSEPQLLDVPPSAGYSSDTLHSTKSEGSQLRNKKKGKKEKRSKSASKSTLEGSREDIHPDVQQSSQTLKAEKGATSSRSSTLDRSSKSGTLTKGGTLRGLFKTKSSTLKSNKSSGSKDSLSRRHRDQRESTPDEQGNFFTRLFRRSTMDQKKKRKEVKRRSKSEEKELLTPRHDDEQQDGSMFALRASSEESQAAPIQQSETPLLDTIQQDAEAHNAAPPDKIEEQGRELKKVLSRSQELILEHHEMRHQFLMNKTINTSITSSTTRNDKAVAEEQVKVSTIERSTIGGETGVSDPGSLEETIYERKSIEIHTSNDNVPVKDDIKEKRQSFDDSFEIINGPEQSKYDEDFSVPSTTDVSSELQTLQLEAQKIRGDIEKSSQHTDDFEIINAVKHVASDVKDIKFSDEFYEAGFNVDFHEKRTEEIATSSDEQVTSSAERVSSKIGSTELFIDEGANSIINNVTEHHHEQDVDGAIAGPDENHDVICLESARELASTELIMPEVHKNIESICSTGDGELNKIDTTLGKLEKSGSIVAEELAATESGELQDHSVDYLLSCTGIEHNLRAADIKLETKNLISETSELPLSHASMDAVFSGLQQNVGADIDSIKMVGLVPDEQLQQRQLDDDLVIDVSKDITKPQLTDEFSLEVSAGSLSADAEHVQMDSIEGQGTSVQSEVEQVQSIEVSSTHREADMILDNITETSVVELESMDKRVGDKIITTEDVASKDSFDHDDSNIEIVDVQPDIGLEFEQNTQNRTEVGNEQTAEYQTNTNFTEPLSLVGNTKDELLKDMTMQYETAINTSSVSDVEFNTDITGEAELLTSVNIPTDVPKCEQISQQMSPDMDEPSIAFRSEQHDTIIDNNNILDCLTSQGDNVMHSVASKEQHIPALEEYHKEGLQFDSQEREIYTGVDAKHLEVEQSADNFQNVLVGDFEQNISLKTGDFTNIPTDEDNNESSHEILTSPSEANQEHNITEHDMFPIETKLKFAADPLEVVGKDIEVSSTMPHMKNSTDDSTTTGQIAIMETKITDVVSKETQQFPDPETLVTEVVVSQGEDTLEQASLHGFSASGLTEESSETNKELFIESPHEEMSLETQKQVEPDELVSDITATMAGKVVDNAYSAALREIENGLCKGVEADIGFDKHELKGEVDDSVEMQTVLPTTPNDQTMVQQEKNMDMTQLTPGPPMPQILTEPVDTQVKMSHEFSELFQSDIAAEKTPNDFEDSSVDTVCKIDTPLDQPCELSDVQLDSLAESPQQEQNEVLSNIVPHHSSDTKVEVQQQQDVSHQIQEGEGNVLMQDISPDSTVVRIGSDLPDAPYTISVDATPITDEDTEIETDPNTRSNIGLNESNDVTQELIMKQRVVTQQEMLQDQTSMMHNLPGLKDESDLPSMSEEPETSTQSPSLEPEVSVLEERSAPLLSEDPTTDEQAREPFTQTAIRIASLDKDSDEVDEQVEQSNQTSAQNEDISQQPHFGIVPDQQIDVMEASLVDSVETKEDVSSVMDQQSTYEYEGSNTESTSYVLQEFVWEHGGQQVYVSGSFNDWTPAPMTGSGGMYKLTLEIPVGRHYYRYTVDGETLANPIEDMEGDLNVMEVKKWD